MSRATWVLAAALVVEACAGGQPAPMERQPLGVTSDDFRAREVAIPMRRAAHACLRSRAEPKEKRWLAPLRVRD